MSEKSNGGRVTYRDIMDFQEKVFNELTEVRSDISLLRESAATDRTSVKSLLRRDTIGYVWDSFNTLIATVCVAYFWGRN